MDLEWRPRISKDPETFGVSERILKADLPVEFGFANMSFLSPRMSSCGGIASRCRDLRDFASASTSSTYKWFRMIALRKF